MNKLLEVHKRPFVLQEEEKQSEEKQSEAASANVATIITVVKLWMDDLNNPCAHFGIWRDAVLQPEICYSKPFREILIKDLQSQVSDLDLERDSQLFASLTLVLYQLDSLCLCHSHVSFADSTLAALFPPLETWLSRKYL